MVLDLARVGSGRGVDCVLLEALRRAHPHVDLLAGGGIGTARDLERLADAGLDGALVATALHDGRIRRGDVAAGRRADHPRDSPQVADCPKFSSTSTPPARSATPPVAASALHTRPAR